MKTRARSLESDISLQSVILQFNLRYRSSQEPGLWIMMTIHCCVSSPQVQGADLFRLVQTALISFIKLQDKQADGQSAKTYCSKGGRSNL